MTDDPRAADASPDASLTARLRTRRAILTGALGGLGAWVAGSVARVSPTHAAAGSSLIIGSQTNNAGTADTQLLTNSSVIAFKLLQNGPGTALMGHATAATGGTRGVYGRSDSPNGDGVQARNAGAEGTGAAIRAFGGNNPGVVATSDHNGVFGSTGFGNGVLGTATTTGDGVYGLSDSGTGIHGDTIGTGYAGYFNGPVYVTGLLTKAGGGFKIDHPLDPARQYLQHSFVESPEMKNVYDGVVTLNSGGEATVKLPSYFGTLNRDERYQLTAIGAFAPLYVKSKLSNGRFVIGGGNAGQEVSWQVTGIRKDRFAVQHPIVVEEPKVAADRGKYLHPELYGQPPTRAVRARPTLPTAAVPPIG
jgi:hypothetical protein